MRFISPQDWCPQGVKQLEPKALTAVKDTGCALVAAGPGAGKTELLAQRAGYLLQTGLCPPPRRILAISFKRDAAKTLRERVALRCGPELSRRFDSFTFDAFAKSLVDRFRPALPEEFRLSHDYIMEPRLTESGRARTDIDALAGGEAGVTFAQLQEYSPTELIREYVVGKPLRTHPDLSESIEDRVARAYWHFMLRGGPRSTVNFQMLGCLADLLLHTNQQITAALRATYAFVFMDEFQDTTGAQYRLLRTAFLGSEAVLTAVGDHRQRIMVWAGASEQVGEMFRKDFGAISCDLDMNYRSAPRLVQIQQRLLLAIDPSSSTPVSADDGREGEGECRALAFNNSTAEAHYIADLIAEQITNQGVPPHDICVLARRLAARYTQELQGAFTEHGISNQVETDLQDLLAEPVTQTTLNFIRLATLQRAPASWTAAVDLLARVRGFEESDDEAGQITQELEDFLATLRQQLPEANDIRQVETLVSQCVEFLGRREVRHLYPQYRQGTFLDDTIHRCSQELATARARSKDWADAVDDFTGARSVRIMTIHKSKGLEFHTVILLGLEDYAFGHLRGNVSEEGCSFMVAFSRAKKCVVLTFSEMRDIGWGMYAQSRDAVQGFYQLLEDAGVPVEHVA